jgi:hypothetical protein
MIMTCKQKCRRNSELAEDLNDTYGAPRPSEEPSIAEQSAINVDTIEHLQGMRPHRERKVQKRKMSYDLQEYFIHSNLTSS